MLACYHPLTDRILLGLILGLFLVLAVFAMGVARRRVGETRMSRFGPIPAAFVGVFAALVGVTLWLGSYSRSPLRFAAQPVLRGFVVQKGQGQALRVASGDGFSISHASLAFITPLIEPGAASCLWQSRAGAMVDLPDICDIVYAPPSADYDVLRVRVRSACGLPDSTALLRIVILP